MRKISTQIQLAVVVLFICCTPLLTIADEKCVFNIATFENDGKGGALMATPIPVNPDEKYKIEFTASTTGEHTLEKKEIIRIMGHRYDGNRVRLTFYDKDGKKFHKNLIDIMILSNKKHHYERVFYPPRQAASLQINLRCLKGTNASVEKMTLWTDLEGNEAKFLNPHTTFEHGDLNTYGFSCGGGGRFYTRPDGKTVWKTGFIGWSPFFPVQGGKYYKFFCKGVKYRRGWIWINFYNKDGEKIKNARVEINEKGAETILKMPKGTARAKLQCYYVIIEEFKVTENKKEK